MKKITFKTVIMLLSLFLLMIMVENGTSSNNDLNKTATCPITMTFCIAGAGSGHSLTIRTGGNCTGSIIATIITGSNGCAQYTFRSMCDSTYSIQENCVFSPPTCQYFVPQNFGTSNFPVDGCK